MLMDALESRCIVARTPLIADILFGCSKPKITEAIVASVAVNVVNDAFRPDARFHHPDKSVHSIGAAFVDDKAIA